MGKKVKGDYVIKKKSSEKSGLTVTLQELSNFVVQNSGESDKKAS